MHHPIREAEPSGRRDAPQRFRSCADLDGEPMAVRQAVQIGL
jgi:hypothetical protein